MSSLPVFCFLEENWAVASEIERLEKGLVIPTSGPSRMVTVHQVICFRITIICEHWAYPATTALMNITYSWNQWVWWPLRCFASAFETDPEIYFWRSFILQYTQLPNDDSTHDMVIRSKLLILSYNWAWSVPEMQRQYVHLGISVEGGYITWSTMPVRDEFRVISRWVSELDNWRLRGGARSCLSKHNQTLSSILVTRVGGILLLFEMLSQCWDAQR